MSEQRATVAEMWRYPVKSMRGERVEPADVTDAGFVGDRATRWSIRRPARSAARSIRGSGVRSCNARRGISRRRPRARLSRRSSITLPERRRRPEATIRSVDERLSAVFGRPVQLTTVAPEGNGYLAVWPDAGRRHARRLPGAERGRRHRGRRNAHRSRGWRWRRRRARSSTSPRCTWSRRRRSRVSASWSRRARSRSSATGRTS